MASMTTSSANVAGALIAIFGSVSSNLGTNVQKQAHSQNKPDAKGNVAHYTTQKLWWCGMSLTIVGALGDLVALSIASPPLVTGRGQQFILHYGKPVCIHRSRWWHHVDSKCGNCKILEQGAHFEDGPGAACCFFCLCSVIKI